VMGVETVIGDVVTVRVMIKTKALEQFALARKFRERAKVRLEHEGIVVPKHLPWGSGPGAGPAAGPGAGPGNPSGN
jgi:moderate conductance mechanosensitive channel